MSFRATPGSQRGPSYKDEADQRLAASPLMLHIPGAGRGVDRDHERPPSMQGWTRAAPGDGEGGWTHSPSQAHSSSLYNRTWPPAPGSPGPAVNRLIQPTHRRTPQQSSCHHPARPQTGLLHAQPDLESTDRNISVVGPRPCSPFANLCLRCPHVVDAYQTTHQRQSCLGHGRLTAT
jgi:hypothetical protein